MSWRGRSFFKMTGSGNDFVFFDAREEPAGILETPRAIAALCDRRRGVGGDGVVFVERDPANAFAIRYFNRDGSLAELCGNASLCSVALATRLGIALKGSSVSFGTPSGVIVGRMTPDGPEIESTPVQDVDPAFDTPLLPGERRIGFARVGVPHLVVLCDDVESVDVVGRGRALRNLPQLSAGANANFISPGSNGWAMRTYERGVEDETLACGTGSVACATLLSRWGMASGAVRIETRSGVPVCVRLRPEPESRPRLEGEGRLLFEGTLDDLPGIE